MSTSLKFADASMKDKQTIVECPSCHTRFAVDTAAIEAVEDPRFHCSRCDHVFRFEDSGKDITAIPPKTLQTELFERETEVKPAAPEIVTKTTEAQDGIVAVYRNPSPVRPPPLHRITDNVKPLEIPRRWDASLRAAPPRENLSETVETPHRPEKASAQIPIFSIKSEEQPAMQNSPGQNPPRVEDTIEIESFGAVKNTPLADSPGLTERPIDLLSPAPKKTPSRSLAPLSPPKQPTVWTHVALPIGLFLVLLLGAAVAIRMSDKLATRFMKAAVPGAIEAAPGELFLKNTRFNKITLDGGEVVRVISGTIVNSSDATFRDVTLEAVLFDGAGKPIGTVRADAGSTLAKSKIRSLTPEMIQELQGAAASKRSILKAGDDRDFAIVLIGSQYSNARHFGARIYSAKQAS